MKLARKISIALGLMAFATLVVLGTLLIRWDRDRSNEDMEHDHRLLGRVLVGAVAQSWMVSGEGGAMSLLREASRHQAEVRLRWVWLDPESLGPPLSPADRDRLSRGTTVFLREGVGEAAVMRTYAPVQVSGRFGAVEISESLRRQHQHRENMRRATTAATLVIAALFLLGAVWLGRWLVGKPVQALATMAQRIGGGELEARVLLPQKDELGDLGEAMNRMAGALALSREQLAAEEKARLSTLEQLRHADRLTTVGKLASGVAHELGTPLNVIAGRARMIWSREVEGEEALESARIIERQAQVMTRIIRQLLDFARRRVPHRARENVAELVSSALNMLKPLAAKKEISLTFAPAELGLGAQADVDGGQVQQILANLVMNAIQAVKPRGEVRVALDQVRAVTPPSLGGTEGRYVRIQVTDDGEGIPADILPHIFEPFVTTKDVGEGTGLGLSVSWGMVQDQGGWIEVESEPSHGSRFNVYLPAAEV